MATKKFLELQEFSGDELRKELEETEAQYQKMKFDHAVKGLDNPMLLRAMRRDIARLHSEVRRRELKEAGEEVKASRSKIRARRKK